MRTSPRHAERRGTALLNEWLGGVAQFEERPKLGAGIEPDLLVRTGRTALVVEFKAAADSASIGPAAEQALRAAARVGKTAVPVVAVPFMGDAGKRLCERLGVAWFDLSGNAKIIAPGLRIQIEGRPNSHKRPGRPSSVFTPRSSRIARHLLLDPRRSVLQRELSAATGLEEGFTSRVVRRLEADGFIERDAKRGVRPKDPDLLLDAWHDVYDFSKHTILRGHVVTRSPEEGQRRLIETLRKKKIRAAATGLGAAWLMTRFASFRLVSIFVEDEPEPDVLSQAGFRPEERGANTWLVIPNDPDVFTGVNERDGTPCVHPVQAFLDLKGHPERAPEAAAELRKQLITWRP